MKTKFILYLILFGSLTGNLLAQNYVNRYAFDLIKTDDGFKLQDEEKIKGLGILNFEALPVDMLVPYFHQNTFIEENEFEQCTTKSFVFKSYPNYQLRLEVDLPLRGEKYPFIMWIHGGGWEAGDLYGLSGQSKYLAGHGIAGVRISYSLLPQGGNMHLAWQDIQDAMEFIRIHAKELNIDASRFGFAGHSAGAHLAAYAAMRTPDTKLLIAINGFYDLNKIQKGFEPNDHHFQFLGTTVAEREWASPITYVHSKAPFCLLGYSTGDFLVDAAQVKEFAKRLNENGVEYELMIKPLYAHGSFLATDLFEPGTMKMLITAKKYLK